jgi:hypothetical protein
MRTALFSGSDKPADPEVQHSGKDAQDIARQNVKKKCRSPSKAATKFAPSLGSFAAFICQPLPTQESAPRTFPTTLAIDARHESASLSISHKVWVMACFDPWWPSLKMAVA